jgi:nicotinamidase-related amidase
MAVTQLDTAAALIVIDLQKGIVARPTVHPVSEIIGRSARLARAFRERGLPVVLVNVTGAAPGRTDAGPRNLLRFRPIGPSLFLNWNSSPPITLSASNA